MQLRNVVRILSMTAACVCASASVKAPLEDSVPKLFPISAADFPLSERIILTKGVAHFETKPPGVESKADVALLSALPRTRCWYGASDCLVYPFILPLDKKAEGRLPASAVLKALRATRFKSTHIKNLDTERLAYPKNLPFTFFNDEIHTDHGEQNVFCKEEDLVIREGEISKDFLPGDSLKWHKTLRASVRDGHLYYVLLHAKPRKHGNREMVEWVVLFAVGVSKQTGNLIGAVTYQACHNFCD